jgi:hypothetical protein
VFFCGVKLLKLLKLKAKVLLVGALCAEKVVPLHPHFAKITLI